MKFLPLMMRSLRILISDKYLLSLSLLPLILGMVVYYFGGQYIYEILFESSLKYVNEHFFALDEDSIFKRILSVLIYGVLFFVGNWTFVLFVSLLATPFNDLIAGRVENIVTKNGEGNLSSLLDGAISGFIPNMVNEIKKVFFILFLTFVSFLLALFPPTAILVPIITSYLVVIQFTDYSWSRNQLSYKSCISEVKSSWFTSLISGLLFMAMLTIPIINIFSIPLGVVYFTTLRFDR